MKITIGKSTPTTVRADSLAPGCVFKFTGSTELYLVVGAGCLHNRLLDTAGRSGQTPYVALASGQLGSIEPSTQVIDVTASATVTLG